MNRRVPLALLNQYEPGFSGAALLQAKVTRLCEGLQVKGLTSLAWDTVQHVGRIGWPRGWAAVS